MGTSKNYNNEDKTYRSALHYIVNLLSRRDLHKFKIKKTLLKKGFEEEVIDQALKILIEKGLYKEDRFIYFKVVNKMKKGYSPEFIMSFLLKEKIDVDYSLINDIFEENHYHQERQIEEIIKKKSFSKNDPKEELRLLRHLLSKGHELELCKSVLARLL